MKHMKLETRSALPIETRSDDDDPIATATRALEDMRTAFDERMTAVDDLAARLDEVETRLARPAVQTQSREETPIDVRAFTGFIRQGREALSADEVRSLRVADDTAGGYLAPAQFTTEMVKNLVEFSPVRSAARVSNTSSGSMILPKRTGTLTASWVGETESRTSTETAYGQVEIPAREAACYVDVSNTLLEDAAVNIAAELSVDFAEEFGRLEGAAFVNGTGVKQPEGFMTNADVAYTANGHASTLQADALISLMYALPAAYRNRGAWMLNGTTLATVRKLKDGQNNYLWQPSYQAGQPETLLGRPVIEATDMPDVSADAFPIVFGDFAQAYRIIDRVSLSVLRDPYSQATSGLTRFHARRRVGGAVVKAEAIRKLKIATS